MEISGRELKGKIKLINRTTEKMGYPAFEWSSSGFDMNFRGEEIAFHLCKESGDRPICIMIETDGKRENFNLFKSSVLKISSLKNEKHSLRLLRTTESRMADSTDLFFYLEKIEILGENAEILEPPSPKKHKIAFFGDSITCGYGVLGKNEDKSYEPTDEDSTKAYAYLTAKYFDADLQTVAISGQGIVCNCHGERGYPVSDYYNYLSPFAKSNYNHKDFSPDIVVVNIGTNDQGYAKEEDVYKKALSFIKRIRKDYKNAEIIWMYGLMGNSLSAPLSKAVNEFSKTDKHISFLETRCIDANLDEIGIVNHPNINGQKVGAEYLINHIKKITNWQ